MKKEELERLKAKYWAGESSLEEDRMIREAEQADPYFSVLKATEEEEMNLQFDDFINTVAPDQQQNDRPKIRSIYRKISVAASLLFVAGGIWYFSATQKEHTELAKTDDTKPHLTVPVNKEVPKPQEVNTTQPEIETPVRIAAIRQPQKKKVIKKEVTKTITVPIPENELYVEVNGVKIYNEEEALKITEEVLSLASNNIRKGLEATRNIKYLTIEL
ncbi:hypothetical protein HMPREF0765_1316 [Sphingobacterium spiritivorum ATCC 33300]|uniref:Uncharacterized protein n=1 Tax=Sphingobacterium spiritivorum ATCC 33300 TaxID=525372 RepID=C2FVG0_SPHSI|nr:hypothetical protein [Sphingobacterium spiritivorum]EEI93018.1 hypothetical protein HMPREF0765_1316 [Sphingobacterium spiritivorum ATCC 33300]QQS96172.1 hypothetical protein I6J03_00225 [Sphingobacterium spiritivorum]